MIRSRTASALFGIVIYPGVEPIDLGATLGVISMAQRILPRVRAITMAASPGEVALAGGLRVIADYGLRTVPPLDVVIVTGGPGWSDAAEDVGLRTFLRGQPAPIIASVCTGALILARAGLLNGRAATTRRTALGAEMLSPLARFGTGGVEAVVVDTGDVVTGGGVSLATDTTLHLLGRLYGADAAAEVAVAIEYDRAWAANRLALGVVAPEMTSV